MLTFTPTGHQTNLFGNDLIQQLDPEDPLLQLAQALPWAEFEVAVSGKHPTMSLTPDMMHGKSGVMKNKDLIE